MTEYERMIKGLIYDPSDKEITEMQQPMIEKLREFNSLSQNDYEGKEKYMKSVFASCGKNCYIEQPFYANWGGAHVYFGDNVYANFGLTLVDDGCIYVGDSTMFGPNVTIATANHPINPELRLKQLQYNKDIHIGKNVWVGANVVIVPGITIGDNSVIGAGSIVTKDIPANAVAVGNPCRVMREIGEHDREYFYKNEKIDIQI